MGLIRFLLALSVLVNHSGPLLGLTFVGGPVAVKAFYIISGFYMSLILNEKYVGKKGSYKLFITNRFLRIYPIYWFVLICTVGASIIMFNVSGHATAGQLQPYVDYIHGTGGLAILTVAYLLLSQILLFGQDAALFMGIRTDSGGLYFTGTVQGSPLPAHTFLLVPQAWTIGLELLFYVIAPFIVRRNFKYIIGLIALSIVLRWFLYSNGLNHDPWTYRFFPTEIAFFLLGNISYRMYVKIKDLKIEANILRHIQNASFGLVLVITLLYSMIDVPHLSKIYYLLFFVALPFIFLKTKRNKLDARIGELSYPMYITHILVLSVLIRIPNIPPTQKLAPILIVITILFSILLNRFIALPIEKIRQNRIKNAAR